MHDEETNWYREAAWTFGAWSLLVPISASMVVWAFNRDVDSRERYRTELSSLRLEVTAANATQNETMAGIISRQMEVMRRVDALERAHLSRHRVTKVCFSRFRRSTGRKLTIPYTVTNCAF